MESMAAVESLSTQIVSELKRIADNLERIAFKDETPVRAKSSRKESVRRANVALRVHGANLTAIARDSGVARATLRSSRQPEWVKWRKEFDRIREATKEANIMSGFRDGQSGELHAADYHDFDSIDERLDREEKSKRRRSR